VALSPGTRIGPYEITGEIGVGGMGEVYRAVDTNLKRAVAIKVLPQAVAGDLDRLARFQREAEVLAALNHPNIAAIYGLERIPSPGQGPQGATALVMEFVEGSTLADRVAQGALPAEEALAIVKQVADALEAAHEQGIAHRDLKPANIKVRSDGAVKVLDFGLAKALGGDATSTTIVSQLPTVTSPAVTQMGMILGTAAYMSPEQAAGKPVDKRTDIWSFGVVLWELLAGRRLFDGETVQQTLADVLRAPIDFAAVPTTAPWAVRALLERCLNRDPRARLRDIGEARLVLQEAIANPARSSTRSPDHPSTVRVAGAAPNASWTRAAWAAAGVGVLALAVGATWSLRPTPARPPLLQVDLVLPEGVTIQPPGPPRLALSHDGSRLAFTGIDAEGQSHVWVRNMQTGSTLLIPETEGGEAPTWSPDGRWLGFAVGGRAMRVEAAGGTPTVVADGSGIQWNAQGGMLISGLPGDENGAIRHVPSTGGQPRVVLPLDATTGEQRQVAAGFLPDGQRFLYQSQGRDGLVEMLGSLDGRTRQELFRGTNSPARFLARTPDSPDGWLVYVRQRQILVRPFDAAAAAFTGDERVVVDGVPNGPVWTAAPNGLFAFLRGETAQRRLAWYDRDGTMAGVLAESGLISNPRLSPDERTIAFARDQRTLVHEIARGLTTELMAERAVRPVWRPDSRRLFLDTVRDGKRLAIEKAADGSPGETVRFQWNGPAPAGVLDVTRDGRWLLVLEDQGTTLVSALGDNKRVPFSPERLLGASFSPDGRWVLVTLRTGGRFEVFAVPVPAEVAGPTASTARVQISVAGGTQPLWSRNGREIFYVGPDLRMMAVPVEREAGTLNPGVPQALFETRLTTGADRQYDVAADGQRFLVAQAPPTGAQAQVSVLVNWQRLLD